MLHKLVALQKGVKHQARIWKGCFGSDVRRWHRACIRCTSFSQSGNKRVIIRPIHRSVSISDPALRYNLKCGVQRVCRKKIIWWVRQILINWAISDINSWYARRFSLRMSRRIFWSCFETLVSLKVDMNWMRLSS